MVKVSTEYLEELHRRSGMTHQQISEQSGIPLGTVSRIMAGQTADPSFVSMASIICAMHGSIDEMVGIGHPPLHSSSESHAAYTDTIRTSREAYSHAYDSIAKQMANKDKWVNMMFVYCAILTAAAIALAVLVDI